MTLNRYRHSIAGTCGWWMRQTDRQTDRQTVSSLQSSQKLYIEV